MIWVIVDIACAYVVGALTLPEDLAKAKVLGMINGNTTTESKISLFFIVVPLQETYKTLMISALFPIQRVRFRLGYLRLCDAPRASIPDQRIGTHARCRLR